MARRRFEESPVDSLFYHDLTSFRGHISLRQPSSHEHPWGNRMHSFTARRAAYEPRDPSPWQQYYYFGHGPWTNNPSPSHHTWYARYDGFMDPPPAAPRRGGIIPPECQEDIPPYSTRCWQSFTADPADAFEDYAHGMSAMSHGRSRLQGVSLDGSGGQGPSRGLRHRLVPLLSRTCSDVLGNSGFGRQYRRLRAWARHRAAPLARHNRPRTRREISSSYPGCVAAEQWADGDGLIYSSVSADNISAQSSPDLAYFDRIEPYSGIAVADQPLSPLSQCPELSQPEYHLSLPYRLDDFFGSTNLMPISPTVIRIPASLSPTGACVPLYGNVSAARFPGWPIACNNDYTSLQRADDLTGSQNYDIVAAEDHSFHKPRIVRRMWRQRFHNMGNSSQRRSRTSSIEARPLWTGGNDNDETAARRRLAAECAFLRRLCAKMSRQCERLRQREALLRQRWRRARAKQLQDGLFVLSPSSPENASPLSSNCSWSSWSSSRSSLASCADTDSAGSISSSSSSEDVRSTRSTTADEGVYRDDGASFAAVPPTPAAGTRFSCDRQDLEIHKHHLENYNAAWSNLTARLSSSSPSSMIPWPTSTLCADQLTTIPTASEARSRRRRHNLNTRSRAAVNTLPTEQDNLSTIIKYNVFSFLLSPFGFRPVVFRHGESASDGLDPWNSPGGAPVKLSFTVNDDLDGQDYRARHAGHQGHSHGECAGEDDGTKRRDGDLQGLKSQIKQDLKRWHPDRLLCTLSSISSNAPRPVPGPLHDPVSSFPSRTAAPCTPTPPLDSSSTAHLHPHDISLPSTSSPSHSYPTEPPPESKHDLEANLESGYMNPPPSPSWTPSPTSFPLRGRQDNVDTAAGDEDAKMPTAIISDAEKALAKDVVEAVLELWGEVKELEGILVSSSLSP